MNKLASVLVIVSLTACTDDGLIHPAALGVAAGVAAVENPSFDQGEFNRNAQRYYRGGYSSPSRTLPPSASRTSSSGCPVISRGVNVTSYACNSIQ